MPITPHVDCTEPPANTRICRFIDLPKLRDLFANEELYFRRTDLFKETDPNEALPSEEYARRVLRLQRYDLHDELTLNNDLAFARQISESYFLNCWQLFEGETLDTWKTYGSGVAVFSRFELLKAQVAPMLDNILLGIVRYGEKDMTGYNLIRFLYTKRRLFEKERELRVVLQCYDPVGGANRHYNLMYRKYKNQFCLPGESRNGYEGHVVTALAEKTRINGPQVWILGWESMAGGKQKGREKEGGGVTQPGPVLVGQPNA